MIHDESHRVILSHLFPKEIVEEILAYSMWSMTDLFCCQWALLLSHPSLYMQQRLFGFIKWYTQSHDVSKSLLLMEWHISSFQGIQSIRLEKTSSYFLYNDIHSHHDDNRCDRTIIELGYTSCQHLSLWEILDCVFYFYHNYPPYHLFDTIFPEFSQGYRLWKCDLTNQESFIPLLSTFFQQSFSFRQRFFHRQYRNCSKKNTILQRCFFCLF